MGDVILFRPSRSAGRSNSATDQTQDARILFFTGVRYERHPQPLAEPAPTTSKAPPRGSGGGRGKRKRA